MVLTPREPRKLEGTECFRDANEPMPFTVSDFWSFAFSVLHSNMLRGVVAEFLVDRALNPDAPVGFRDPWAEFDVKGDGGLSVEVKCGAFLQAWQQPRLSKPIFARLKTRRIYFDEASEKMRSDGPPDYKAQVYVLALLHEIDPTLLDPLDIRQWSFYVFSRDEVKALATDAGSIPLTKLEKRGFQSLKFNQLRAGIQAKHNHTLRVAAVAK